MNRRRIEESAYWVSPAGRRSRWRTRLFHVLLGVFTCASRVVGLYRRGRANALAPRLVELDLSFRTLPWAFDGYRILHLSDTHLDSLPELAEIAGRLLAGIEVDVLALTGDILTESGPPLRSAMAPLTRLLAQVHVADRRLAVLGNHDCAAMAERLEELGLEVLLNRSVTLERGGDRVAITGVDDVHAFYTDAARAALFDGGAGFRIALVHSPELADIAAEAGIALYLCGHTHGGQICLPNGRAIVTCLTRCRHAAKGLWRSGGTIGYTSRGLGSGPPPLRFNCPPEITVITLRRAR